MDINRSVPRMIIFGIAALLAGIIVHELTHVFFIHHYGCEATFGVDWHRIYIEPSGDCMSTLSETERDRLHDSQHMVEAIGYQLLPLYFIGGMCFELILSLCTGLDSR